MDMLCDCKLICTGCGSCIHQFSCTCVDSCIKWNMCKHIHLVCRYLRNSETELNCSYTNEDQGIYLVLKFCLVNHMWTEFPSNCYCISEFMTMNFTSYKQTMCCYKTIRLSYVNKVSIFFLFSWCSELPICYSLFLYLVLLRLSLHWASD